MGVIKHATASVFLFGRVDGGWRLGLIRHPRFGRWMLPGGHVEPGENPAEAALREVREEAGLAATLLAPHAGSLPGYPAAARVPVPVWITEQDVPPERRLASAHVHVDHLYLAVAGSASPTTDPELPFRWYAREELSGLEMFPDTRGGAELLFPLIEELAGPAGQPASAGTSKL
ncbi:NUDIX hydrolase [Catenuloplanes atrovinosus]|uniref:8-oxo-dGTP pyrophosphatase MutT (NUDIX family) n=1 Tax=Catenuloplanes atrovinosus TaxID=137266 RepID=A0AAE4CBE7_9ACTN|nr:NUDIX domain-containing protein [Catenuloplanes atrovinosus]MDR7278606.1 8-oxo-dGTP pyrophosphatase MutT (NUDIX family) [Catenuloplanes atrovinosus]